MKELFYLTVYKKGNTELPLLELHPKNLEELLRWESDMRKCYWEEHYVVKTAQKTFEEYHGKE